MPRGCEISYQVNGYAGPRQQTVAQGDTNPALVAHLRWSQQTKTLDPLGSAFLDAVDTTRARVAATGELPEDWSYVDIEGLDTRMDWTDLWFASLVGGVDTPRLKRALYMYGLYGVSDPTTAAGILTRQFPPETVPLRLVVPQELVGPLTQADRGWIEGSTVFPRPPLDVPTALTPTTGSNG